MDSINLIPSSEATEVEGRSYVVPTLPVAQTEDFITKFRDTQRGNTAQIAQATQALGTDVPSSLGGLSGAGSYFTSRYQTPQTNTAVQNLRTAAQADALNTALANEKAMWQKRYQDAYRAYQRRADAKTNPSTTNTTGDVSQSNTTLEITDVSTEALANSRYQKLLTNYLQAGYPTDVAEKKAKEDFGKAVSTDTTVSQYPYTRTKATVGSENSYVYTLPNGNTVLVDEDKYELIRPDYGGYALKDKQTGELKQVGE